MPSRTEMKVSDLFLTCQDSVHKHSKLIPELRKLFDKLPEDVFFNYYVNSLGSALTAPDRNFYAERVLEFASTFASSLNEPDKTEGSNDEEVLNPFLLKLIHYLADRCHSTDQVYRFRSCQLLKKLLHSLDSVDDDLYDKLCKIMLERLKDKVAAVRVQAIFALSRLQDPGDPNCPIILAFIYHLGQDLNPDVRKAILSGIDASPRTLIPIVERTRDVKDTVRMAAYSYIAERINLKWLTISNRVRLLKEGLNDRSDSVKKIIAKMILPSWIKKSENIINFIQYLDVQGSLDTTKLALETHFKSQSLSDLKESLSILDENRVIPLNELSSEKAMYWCCVIQYLNKMKDPKADECAESLLPELVEFIAYIKEYILSLDSNWDLEKKLDHEFISQQLVMLAGEFEMSDLASQRFLDQLINELIVMSNLGSTIIKPLVSCYIKLHQGFDSQLNGIAEIISNIREPISTVPVEKVAEERRQIELEIAKVKVKLNIERDELAQHILEQEFVLAQEAKSQIKLLEAKKNDLENNLIPSSQEVRIENNDPHTILRCLTLLTELLQQQTKNKMTATLQTMMQTLILPGIQNADPAVRNQAVLALGLCCLISKDAACQHFLLLLQITQIDQEAIQVNALKTICDLLLNYGLETFQADEEQVENAVQVVPETPPGLRFTQDETLDKNKFNSNVITIIRAQLDSEFQDVRAIAAEGLGKLLLYNRIHSPNLLSRLIILWYNPATENDTGLRHFLGIFLPYFASSGESGQQCFEEAFLQTILTLMDAPRSSPLMQVDTVNVGRFILQLTSKTFAAKNMPSIQETTAHDRLAWAICNEIHKTPQSPCTRDWTKILTCIDIPKHCHSSHKELLVLVDKLFTKVSDRPSIANLKSFNASLSGLVSSSQCSSQTDGENGLLSSPAASRFRLDADGNCSDSSNSRASNK